MRTWRNTLLLAFALSPAVIAQLRYACPSGEVFHVAVHASDNGKEGHAIVLMQGKPPLTLRQTPAASGAKYTDGFTVLSTKGNEATLESGTVNAKGCTGSMLGRKISGMFVYMADAATFTDCATGRRVPVAMEAGYKELERMYTEKRPGPGTAVYVNLLGRIENKPKTEGAGTVPTLVVEKVESLETGKQCSAGAGALTGKWTLTTLNGQGVTLSRPAFIEFPAEGNRSAGFAGCNRFTSAYKLDGQKLRFQGAASTQMACPQPGMGVEGAFHKALSQVAAYRIAGSELKLQSASGETLAVFKKE